MEWFFYTIFLFLMKTQFLIAAPSSGSGKTSFTQGILRYLKNKNIDVQAYKCGPDYLDTKHHKWASGNVSINLDSFMSSEEHVKEIYAKNLHSKDTAIVEGVMGLFDGANKMQGSSASIAELLDIPVVLIMNAKAMAYSAAPILYGFKNFYPNVKIAGVVFNFVNSESHYSFLKDACEDVGIIPFGYIPRNEEIKLPSRHLGLKIDSKNKYDDIINTISEHIDKTVDIELILETCKQKSPDYKTKQISSKGYTIAVARDKAFNFTYQENINSLSELGKVIYFSPLKDKTIPKADIIYLAGGYPELYLKELSENTSMKNSIIEYYNKGGKLIAECGGMMYLSKNIINAEGEKFPMLSILDIDCTMEDMKLKLGYRKIRINETIYYGHEFHYSKIVNSGEEDLDLEIFSARDKKLDTKIFRKNNFLASYIHFYWADSNFIETIFEL